MHQQKAKHIKRAGLTPDEVQDLMKKSLKDKSEVDPSSGKKFYERKYRPAWEREFPFISKVSSSFQQQMALPSRSFHFYTKNTVIGVLEVTFQLGFLTLVNDFDF